MTVILDPGNDPNSYSDAASRPWKTTAGLWKTDANDTVGQNGDSLGNQLWRTTAATWHTRANTAYDGGVWGTGNTWQTNANTAYDSGVWGTGSTWQARYNSEVTLYNNEVTAYNNALAAALNQSTASISGSMPSSGVWATINAPLTGHYVAYFLFTPSTGQNGWTNLSIRLAGTAQWTHQLSDNATNATVYAGAVELDATAGQAVDLYVNSFSGSNGSGSAGTFSLTFIPTPAHPH